MLKWNICIVLSAIAAYAAPYTARVIAGSDWIGDNGPSRDSLLFQAEGLATDRDGNLYISDAQSHRVRQITPAGIIRTIVGTGVGGFSGDGGPASTAQLSSPYGLAVDMAGNIFIADLGNRRIRRVGLDGTISTVSGETSFRAPRNVAVDTVGNLYVSDFDSGSVYRISPSGAVSVVALLKYPAGLALDRSGTLYIGETGTHLVRKLENGVIRTVTTVPTPTGLAFDSQGTLHVADASGAGIFRIPVTGTAAPLAIAARDVVFAPSSGALYSTDGKLVRSITASGNVVIAGRGNPAHGDYGPATEARLNNPIGLALDAVGNLYIADRDNNRIRRVDAQGMITTYAGTGLAGNAGDGGLAVAALLDQPAAISFDGAGNLYIADQGNGRIRMVNPSGIIFAATSMPIPEEVLLPSLDTDVQLQPTSIIAGKNGVLYAADANRDLVWELTPPVLPPDPSTLVSIVNAASLAGPLAPGMLARVNGIAMSEVLFNGIPATVISNAVLVVPPQLTPGTVDVEFRNAGKSVAHVKAPDVAASPALFVAVNQDGSVNDATHAAERGSVLVLYGTGQGVAEQPVSLRIGSYDSEVLYSGPVADYPGLWQMNARVPSGFFVPGSYALTVGVGTATSPPLRVEVR